MQFLQETAKQMTGVPQLLISGEKEQENNMYIKKKHEIKKEKCVWIRNGRHSMEYMEKLFRKSS